MKQYDVIGLGNTLMDFLIEVDDDRLIEFDLKKGEMHLVDEEKAKSVLEKINEHQLKIETIPGGSSANTLKGIALLGGKAILCGKVGKDSHGEVYVQQIEKHGVLSRINNHSSITGHAVTFITPDSERTFSVHLGAALELYKEDVLEEDIEKSKVLHLEGYQIEGPTKETIMHAIELAKKHDTLVSIDLADPGLIRRNKEFLQDLVMNHADIVFVNEKEAEEFTGLPPEEALNEIANHTKIAVVKLGKKGSLISADGIITMIDAHLVEAVDTTGAGDSYAAGFLYGYTNGLNSEQSGKLGSLLASKVVAQKGVGLKNIDVNKLKEKINDSTAIKNINPPAIQENKMIKIGIIGGSGLDNPNILQEAKDIDVETKWGKPSSPLKVGKISGADVVLLARHGREHTIPPTQVNNQANIQALKDIGCTHIIATTACGSLKKEIGRGDFVVLDQFIDFTRLRKLSFHDAFEPGKISHTPMAEPFHKELRNVLYGTAKELDLKCHPKGKVVTIEGPRFSTKAESKMFASWGADVINMSIAPECSLANEIGLPYAAVAMATDYDCLFDDVPPVTWEEVLKVFKENVGKVTNLLTNVVQKINSCNPSCCCHQDCDKDEEENEEETFDLKSTIRTIPNWPKQGIMFRDITTLIENPKAFAYCIEKFKEKYSGTGINKIAGIEARGFIFGAALAKDLGLPFVLIRKKGKLPGEVVAQEYALEYGADKIEMHTSSISARDNVLLIDDLLATGGTMAAACELVEKVGGKVFETAFVIDLPDLKGAEKLTNYNIFKLVDFEGE